MKETPLMREIQIACCRDPNVRLWRNNVGEGWVGELVSRTPQGNGLRIVLEHARAITFGLAPGTADLIGGVSRIVTPEMVGQRVFVFAAPEVKTLRGAKREEQKNFVAVVKSLGGLSDFVRSVEDARKVLTLDPP